MMESDLKPVIQYSHEHLDPFSVVFLYSNRIGFIPLSDPTSRIYRGICTRNSIYPFFILIPLNFNPIETDSFNFIFYFFSEHERFWDFRYSKSVTYLTYLTQFICNQSSFRFWWTCEFDVVQSGQDKRTAFGRFFTFLTLKRTLAIEHLFIKTNSSFKKHHISNITKFIFQYLRLKFLILGIVRGGDFLRLCRIDSGIYRTYARNEFEGNWGRTDSRTSKIGSKMRIPKVLFNRSHPRSATKIYQGHL